MQARFPAIAALCFSAVAFAQASLESEIKAVNGPISAAIRNKNINAFAKLVKAGVTPDFKYSEPGGKPMDLNGMVAGMKMGLAGYSKITNASATVVSCHERGNTGMAVEKHVLEGVMKGPDKKDHKIIYVGTATSTYKKIHGKWLMATMSMKVDKMLSDGKPMKMGGM